MLIAFSETDEALILLARERLTKKQKEILHYIRQGWQPLNATQLARLLSRSLNCSPSAVWNSINSLKRAGLISCGNVSNKGQGVTLTPAGKLISENGGEENGG